jgi:hypothetical protein
MDDGGSEGPCTSPGCLFPFSVVYVVTSSDKSLVVNGFDWPGLRSNEGLADPATQPASMLLAAAPAGPKAIRLYKPDEARSKKTQKTSPVAEESKNEQVAGAESPVEEAEAPEDMEAFTQLLTGTQSDVATVNVSETQDASESASQTLPLYGQPVFPIATQEYISAPVGKSKGLRVMTLAATTVGSVDRRVATAAASYKGNRRAGGEEHKPDNILETAPLSESDFKLLAQEWDKEVAAAMAELGMDAEQAADGEDGGDSN